MKRYEIEQKFKVREPAKIRRKVLALGAKSIPGGLQKNEYFDRRGELRAQRMVLRLRRDASGARITLKGPKLPGRFTRRLEYETRVDYAQSKAILTGLGFQIFRQYQKKREEFLLPRCVIALDRLGTHGWYLEIEGSETAIARYAGLLGLGPHEREERSYLSIMFPALFRRGRPRSPSRTPNRKAG
ncbi:MAG: class IV adenylate cyclase [Candidatus Omnitrophota bacterium]|jgi:predicted adenylyl cyclase CyaB